MQALAAPFKVWGGQVWARDLDDMVVDGTGTVAAWDGDTFGEILRRADRYQRDGSGAHDDEEREAFERMPRLHGDEVTILIHLLRTYDVPGFNDSGAHLTNMAFYDANLRGLHLAQQEGLARVATHVRRLTKDPADFFGLDVGTLDAGARADVAVIDPAALADWDTEAQHRLHLA